MKLKQLREKKGLQRKFVAEQLNISADHLNLLERGKSQLNLIKIDKLSRIYKIPFGEMAEIAFTTYKEGNNVR